MAGRNVRSLVIPALLAVAGLPQAGPAAATVFPEPGWTTITPEAAGMDPAKLDELASLAGGTGLVIRGGAIVRAWGDPSTGGDWASAGKPVLSTLLFLAADRGLTGLGSTVGEYLEGGSAKDRSIRLWDLANMVSGYSRAEWPGLAFAYNDHAINLYGHVLLEHVYGGTPSQVIPDELAFLGFEDPVSVGETRIGRITGMSVRDFARLGLFWLEEGHWNGAQVIPASYFELIRLPVPPDTPLTEGDGSESWNLGSYGGSDHQGFTGAGSYAMNFWVNAGGRLWPGFSEDVFVAAGHADTKVCWVIPELDIVAVGFQVNADFGRSPGLGILYDSVNGATPVDERIEATSWSSIKARHR